MDTDRVFALIQRAIVKIGEHDTRTMCDTPELAEALGALSTARDLVRPMSYVRKPGYIECPGSYKGDHKPITHGVGRCRYCGRELRTVHYGHNLRAHYVAALPTA